jgi:hypothetical protein
MVDPVEAVPADAGVSDVEVGVEALADEEPAASEPQQDSDDTHGVAPSSS